MTDKLSPKQERFIEEYLIDMNGTQAAIRAGYSANGADVQAVRLLAHASVRAEIDRLKGVRSVSVGLTADEILKEIKRVALFDPRKLYDDNGSALPPSQWDDDTAACVSAIETEQLFEGRGDARELVGQSKKIKLWDKLKALDMGAKHLGLYEKDNAQRAPDLQLHIVNVGTEAALPAPIRGARITSR